MRLRRAAAVCCAAALGACGPGAPEGVDKAELDRAVSSAVGDPGTCVLIAEAGSGDIVYRYGTHQVCGRALPACEGEGVRSANDLAAAVAEGAPPVAASCPTAPDGSRSVGWAAGPVAGRPLVFAAMMEGQRALPGIVMTDRLQRAFQEAGLTGAAPEG